MTHNKYGFLFDLDGVLIDSEKEYSRIWATVNSEFPTGVQNLEIKIKGCTLEKILNDFFPDLDLQKKVVRKLYELEGKMHYEYLPGAYSLLCDLSTLGFPMAMVTSSNNDKMRHLKEELPELLDFFGTVVTADMITRSKPDPEGYLRGAELLGIDPHDCVVFEDSLQGVKAGREAGAFVVGVVGTLPEEALAPFSDIVVDNLENIKINELIYKINGK